MQPTTRYKYDACKNDGGGQYEAWNAQKLGRPNLLMAMMVMMMVTMMVMMDALRASSLDPLPPLGVHSRLPCYVFCICLLTYVNK